MGDRRAGLVDCERRGTWVYYWPLPDRQQWISTLLSVPEPAAELLASSKYNRK